MVNELHLIFGQEIVIFFSKSLNHD